MGEYNDKDLFEEQKVDESKLNEIEGIKEFESDNNFEPKDEEEEGDTEIINNFEPNNESENDFKNNTDYFKPNDEMINKIFLTKETDEKLDHRIHVSKIEKKNCNKNSGNNENEKLKKIYNENPKRIFKDNDFLLKIKEHIKKINWKYISNNWTIKTRINQYSEYKEKVLDPFKDCSNDNPLYRHKRWLETIYNNKEFKLNDRLLSQICNVNPSVIGKWRKKYNIPTQPWGEGEWIHNRSGRKYVRTPINYNHPELKNSDYRLEHIYIMEKHLRKHPELKISKKVLIDGKYLKMGCEIHHINQNPQDNRLKNLWVYETKKKHANGELSLRSALKDLISTNLVEFKKGRYSINKDFKKLSDKPFNTKEKNQFVNYQELNLVKDEIKKLDWNKISNNWNVKIKKNQFEETTITVNPYKNCSEQNPLYRHKLWIQTIIKNEKFNLTDSRLGELCGISKDKARYWRERVHEIEGKKTWGYDRIVDKSDGRIWVKVPKNYENPIVNKEDNHRKFMLEHRYIMETYLRNHPELNISRKCLKDGKYLKSESQVHHINLNFQDNRIENLWVFENVKEHKKATRSLYNLVENLLSRKLLLFDNGKYYIKKSNSH